MKHREDYYRIRNRVPKAAIDSQTRALLEDFGTYFTRMPEAQTIDMGTFLPMFRAAHPTMSADQIASYEGILPHLTEDVGEEERSGIMLSMLELRLGTDMAHIHAALTDLSDDFERDANIKALDYIKMDINGLLTDTHEDKGVSWRLDCLNDSMRNLQGGDFGIIAGRPDKGKTTFIASEVSHMASQLPANRNIVWLNNEGKGERIYMRLIQAALNAQMSEIRAMRDAGVDVGQKYAEIVGDIHRIRIVDIHGLDTYAVENILKQNSAGIVVYGRGN